jgi:hypothetical protein
VCGFRAGNSSRTSRRKGHGALLRRPSVGTLLPVRDPRRRVKTGMGSTLRLVNSCGLLHSAPPGPFLPLRDSDALVGPP